MNLRASARLAPFFLLAALATFDGHADSAVVYAGELWKVKADDASEVVTILIFGSYPDKTHGRIYHVKLVSPPCDGPLPVSFVMPEIYLIPSLDEILEVSVDLEPYQDEIDQVIKLLGYKRKRPGSLYIHERELKNMLDCGY